MFFFFNDTATTDIYTLSLHDALPIWPLPRPAGCWSRPSCGGRAHRTKVRSEEHTSELQSHSDLVCRLLLEKKKKTLKENISTKDTKSNSLKPNHLTTSYYIS